MYCSIFIWRNPAASRVYGGVSVHNSRNPGNNLTVTSLQVIFFLFLVTLLLPAKYIAKLVYFIGGLFFWHITPIIAALPPADRAR